MPPRTPTDPAIDAARRPALLSYVRERRAVLFVGAGLSRPAGFPSWHGLMQQVLTAVADAGVDERSRAELAALLDAGRYPELADQCRELLGRSRLAAILRAELGRPAEPPEATHRAIVGTPWAAVVTTNFDTLLEQAYGRWSDEGIPKAPTGAALGRQGTLLLDQTRFILKAHGSIDDEASLVLTSEDYRRIIHTNPAFQSVMAALLLSHAVVFVGYSLGDPNFRLLLESQLAVFGTEAPPRYALMEAVGPTEAAILRRTTGIDVISYPKGRHESVAAFLQGVAAAVAPAAPDKRSVRVLRTPDPEPALVLSVRTRDALLDLQWFETTTRDLSGADVPFERRWMSTVRSFDWSAISQASSDLSVEGIRRIGGLLADPFANLALPLVHGDPPRLVVLDLPIELAPLPWEWLTVAGTPLGLQAPVCRTVPGLDDGARGRPFYRDPLRVLLVGDALAESSTVRHPLPGTREEVEAIAARFARQAPRSRVTCLTGAHATYDRVLHEITSGYDIVHVTGAAYVDETNESVIPLHDGWVRASELATLFIRRPPGLLFVNEDSSGFVPAFGGAHAVRVDRTRAYQDFYAAMRRHRPGLERVVARAGVGTFVGCMAPARESTARDLAVDFYARLLAGDTAATALFRARAKRAADEAATAVLFAMAGYPDARVVARRSSRAGYSAHSRPRRR